MKPSAAVYLLILGLLTWHLQGNGQEAPHASWKFNLGVDVTYLNSTLDLGSMSQQSFWEGNDLGVVEFEENLIDTINSFVDYQRQAVAYCVAAGADFRKTAESKWNFGVQLLVGFTDKNYRVKNTSTHTTDLHVKSDPVGPMVGFRFRAGFDWSAHWGVEVRPDLIYSWSKSDRITDDLYGRIDFFDESRIDRTRVLYFRVTGLVAYTWRKLKVAAGPGFYGLSDHHEYTIERINPETGECYIDIIESNLTADSFVDGCLGIDWMIIDHLKFSALGAFGKNMMVHGGVVYIF